MKNTMTRKTSVNTSVCNSNRIETVASGLRVRMELKAGLNFTKITY